MHDKNKPANRITFAYGVKFASENLADFFNSKCGVHDCSLCMKRQLVIDYCIATDAS